MKRHLRNKVKLEVILEDNTWFFDIGTIFIFEPVGFSVQYKPANYTSGSQYIKTECIRLNRIFYNKTVYLGNDKFGKEFTELETNIINTTFKVTNYKNYNVSNYLTNEIINNSEIFEDALDAKRDDILTELLNFTQE